ncbi:hypothetical protein GQ42DRAFT_151981 [Ramicandelaber brevisporus]|nr:hypothetical protein GQ42DRAFT_151981 [Ramicandelaber brevisporus]
MPIIIKSATTLVTAPKPKTQLAVSVNGSFEQQSRVLGYGLEHSNNSNNNNAGSYGNGNGNGNGNGKPSMRGKHYKGRGCGGGAGRRNGGGSSNSNSVSDKMPPSRIVPAMSTEELISVYSALDSSMYAPLLLEIVAGIHSSTKVSQLEYKLVLMPVPIPAEFGGIGMLAFKDCPPTIECRYWMMGGDAVANEVRMVLDGYQFDDSQQSEAECPVLRIVGAIRTSEFGARASFIQAFTLRMSSAMEYMMLRHTYQAMTKAPSMRITNAA